MLGGTRFLGVHLVERALERGHEVTLFNRGVTNVQLFPGLEKLIGDRRGSTDAQRGRSWDAVIDTSGLAPAEIAASGRHLAESAPHDVYLSSASVYAGEADADITEDSPTVRVPGRPLSRMHRQDYGPLKLLCEREVRRLFGSRALIVRPGVVVGPLDPTNRLMYWPARALQGGTMLGPGRPEDPISVVDARDLAAWILGGIEAGVVGVYNATSPPGEFRMGQIVRCAAAVAQTRGRRVSVRWVDEETLRAHRVRFGGLPPIGAPGLRRARSDAARMQGLQFRPLEASFLDTYRWWTTLAEDVKRRALDILPYYQEMSVKRGA